METFNETVSSYPLSELQIYFNEQQKATYETIQQLLSTTRQVKEKLLSSLSGIPVHPFERLKTQYLPEQTEPLSIEKCNRPSNFCIRTCSQQISSISVEFSTEWNEQLTHLSSCEIVKEADIPCNAFLSLSENTFVVDETRAAKHLQFVDMINNIPVHLYEQRPLEIAEILITQFIETYKK